ncbi:TorF family putative porin [Leucothrix arctica]|uniref:Outer membrane protein beta-barrel domain-containing protein n=1 Tax=Leucothrix arctica TaxID=1481894 RepID=A0A317CL71_9GAMM|nr:TorF family putative porin [Leucothrix arctica]PWQ99256.1 hypothetical protein DKT75_01540 [Leucothrix arctica]
MNNTYKKMITAGVLISSAVFTTQAMAQAYATIEVSSNKMGRGVTVSDDGPSVTGNLRKNFASGFYVGVLGANVHLPPAEYTEQTYEVDVYGGYTGETANGIRYDMGYMYYAFPAADDDLSGTDYSEVYGVIGYKGFDFEIDYTLDKKDNDGSDDNEHDAYYLLSYNGKTARGIGYGFAAGYVDSQSNASYTHYQASISKDGFKFALDDNDIEDFGLGDPRVSVTWTKHFGF